MSPYSIVATFVGMLSSEVSMEHQLRGMSHVISTGCTSASDAMGYAFQSIQCGRADRVITGGAEACIVPGIMAGFSRMGTMTRRNGDPARASRPFNSDRDGFVMAEGAWILVFESLASARRRGAKPLAEVVGYGTTCDAYHRVRPEPTGEEAGARDAAGLEGGRRRSEPGRLREPSRHRHRAQRPHRDPRGAARVRRTRRAAAGVGAQVDDRPSAGRVRRGGYGRDAEAMRDGWLPPTINHDRPDPACDLDYVANEGRQADIEHAVVNCIAFGSKNSALVVRRWDGHRCTPTEVERYGREATANTATAASPLLPRGIQLQVGVQHRGMPDPDQEEDQRAPTRTSPATTIP